MTLPRFSRRRRRCLAGALLLAGICIAYVQREPLLCGLGRWLNVAGRLEQPVDAVFVLGGGASTRPFVAVEMLRARLAGQILISNVERTSENLDGLLPEEEEITRQIVLRSGIPAEAIVVLSTEVGSTAAEARVLATWLQAHPAARVAVVSSDYHTRRARILISRACGANAGRVVYIGAPTDGFGPNNWWHSEAGLVSYLTEYLKLARTLVR
ncbi:MAG TPA: YdcF family protein [Planctomycetaceae bacterium]|jgi:uncharacterized SAM-binding protein YcdF (DUF218 family)